MCPDTSRHVLVTAWNRHKRIVEPWLMCSATTHVPPTCFEGLCGSAGLAPTLRPGLGPHHRLNAVRDDLARGQRVVHTPGAYSNRGQRVVHNPGAFGNQVGLQWSALRPTTESPAHRNTIGDADRVELQAVELWVLASQASRAGAARARALVRDRKQAQHKGL